MTNDKDPQKPQQETIDFGYQKVPLEEKVGKVASVFHSVANKYDIMNDLMSLGIHRLWKKMTVAYSHIRPGACILDLAGGTGDLAYRLAQRAGADGQIYLADINASMLEMGRKRLINKGCINNIRFVQANAEHLPFPDDFFDCVTIGFGLRNVTDKEQAMREMCRVVKPGGQVLILEFSTPTFPGLKPIYDAYSFTLLPRLGQLIANDAESYQYLVESIRMQPDQETLKNMLLAAGFDHCQYHNFSGGIVALHRAFKY